METAVWSLIHSFLPEVILIGGGMGERHFALYREAAERGHRTRRAGTRRLRSAWSRLRSATMRAWWALQR